MTDKCPLMDTQEKHYHYKVVIVGDPFTGKSSLLSRLSDKEFEPTYAPTIGVDYHVHQLRSKVQGKSVRLSLWDHAGDKKFRSIVTSYFRGAEGVLLVFDVTNQASFANLQSWLAELDNKVVPGSATILVVGNKIDAPHRAVSRDDARAWAFARGFQYMECSALKGTNVEECFVTIATSLVSQAQEREEAEGLEREKRTSRRREEDNPPSRNPIASFFQRNRGPQASSRGTSSGDQEDENPVPNDRSCLISPFLCFLPGSWS